jgi:hypothetical protein
MRLLQDKLHASFDAVCWAPGYKTFSVRNLRIFRNKLERKPFQPSLLFVSRAVA